MEKFKAKMIGGIRHGKTKEVGLETGEYLHKEDRRDVKKTEVHIRHKDNVRRVPQGMVLKQYRGGNEFKRVVNIYEKCKNRGLKVMPTFRANRETKSILMTNLNRWYEDATTGEKRERIALAYNNLPIGKKDDGTYEPLVEGPFISSFANFPDFVDRFLQHAIRAAESGVRLPSDSYFFLVDKEGGQGNIDFVIGDMDNVRITNLDEGTLMANININVKRAKEALHDIIEMYVKSDTVRDGRNVKEAYLSLLAEKGNINVFG